MLAELNSVCDFGIISVFHLKHLVDFFPKWNHLPAYRCLRKRWVSARGHLEMMVETLTYQVTISCAFGVFLQLLALLCYCDFYIYSNFFNVSMHCISSCLIIKIQNLKIIIIKTKLEIRSFKYIFTQITNVHQLPIISTKTNNYNLINVSLFQKRFVNN